MLLERAPQREVRERSSLPLDEGLERRLPARRARCGEDDLERRALGQPGRIPVDVRGIRVRRRHRLARPRDGRAVVGREVRRLTDVFGAHVERREEAAGRGQVRRRLDARGDLRRVDGVDEEEVGAVRSGDRGEVAEVGEVADAPGPTRAHRVQLRHEPPRPAAVPAGRRGKAVRGHDEHGRGRRDRRRPRRAVAAAAWTVCQPSGRSAGSGTRTRHTVRPSTIRDSGCWSGIGMPRHDPSSSSTLSTTSCRVRDMHVQLARARANDDGRRQQLAPGAVFRLDDGSLGLGVRLGRRRPSRAARHAAWRRAPRRGRRRTTSRRSRCRDSRRAGERRRRSVVRRSSGSARQDAPCRGRILG